MAPVVLGWSPWEVGVFFGMIQIILGASEKRTFALWWVLAAISQNVYLVHDPIGLEKLAELLFGPGPRDLAHKHLNGIHIWLVGVV